MSVYPFFDTAVYRKIAFSPNNIRPDLTGLPHESIDEFLARGGKITKCVSNCKEIASRWAMPTNPRTQIGQTIYDWRV